MSHSHAVKCSVQGCGAKHSARGFCRRHYLRVLRKGTAHRNPPTLSERFWSKVERRAPNECWPWIAFRNCEGYGRISVTGVARRYESAHRVSWILANGSLPAGLCVCHRCDNPSCVNPAHLFLGTVADNNADKVAKGRHAQGPEHGARSRPRRQAKGESHGCAKLTDRQVIAIRAAYARGNVTQRELADRFGVAKSRVGAIVRGERWTHV